MTGVAHLRELAARPRAAGSAEEATARAYAAHVLQSAGFSTREEAFEYSAFPGRYGTPLGGAIVAFSVLLAAFVALATPRGELAAIVLSLGLLASFVFGRTMMGNGVLDLDLLRARSTNLVATRGVAEPRVWMVAHLDSKSQPVPSALRVAGVALLIVGVLLALVAAVLTLAGVEARMVWWGAASGAALGALPVMASVVGNASDGAVDNASGAAAVLEAATRLGPDVACGVLMPSAEELGLAGVRAWARGRTPGVALNVDGVDDGGALVVMHSGKRPVELVALLRQKANGQVNVRRMPAGLLTDSVALAEQGWSTVTVSHGSYATLARVHSKRDSLARLKGDSIGRVAELLGLAVEALA